jgi:protein O-mannosyl-transferase
VLDFWPLRRIQGWTVSSEFSIQQISFSKLVAEKVPLFALSAGSAVVTLIAQRGAMNTLNDYSYFVRITNAFYSYVLYLGKTVLPLRLAAIYPHPENTLGWWKPAVALLILTGISAFAWQQRQRHSYLLSGWLWFLGTLVPVIGLVQVGTQAMADRYAYIPLIGIFVIAVWGAADLANFRSVPTSWRIATAGLLLLAFSVLTWRQTGYWRSSCDLWAHALDVTQDNPVAEENMGTVLQDAGRYEDALPHFRHGAALNPQDPVVHANLAATLAQTGRLQEAIPEYETMIRLAHENPSVLAIGYADLGTVYRHLGSYTESRASYMKSLRIDPQQESALRGLNKLEEAIAGSNPDR